MKKYLGKYLEGESFENVSIGLGTTELKNLVCVCWSGDVIFTFTIFIFASAIENVCQPFLAFCLIASAQQLKRTAFDDLGLPVQVSTGHVGTLRINLDWANLAALVELEDVYAVMSTKVVTTRA